ncbi:hypothetical protein WJX74_003129 [Apatococcus lobatus]|uniref:Malonyl-CoA decarboxylase n=1 Tax=Apatococcus lobatus TaxID=904363 RepID=A0AAW1QLF3_9CHLO
MLIAFYKNLSTAASRERFFRTLTLELGVDSSEVDRAVSTWQKAKDQESRTKAAWQIQQASRPMYTSLFVPISNRPEGIKFLVDLRSDVIAASKATPTETSAIRLLNDSLRQSLADWFSVGLLHLHCIEWHTASADLLEKVMKYEAVHAFQGWDDLKRRLAPNRRLYGFFHPSLPAEPLVLLHTALTCQVPAAMKHVLEQPTDQPSAEDATTACFYSISSTQKGLAGIDLGNFLIKQVANRLLAELSHIQTLVTLSPLPAFRGWLEAQLQRHIDFQGPPQHAWPALLLSTEREAISSRGLRPHDDSQPVIEHQTAESELAWALTDDRWCRQDMQAHAACIHQILLRLAARYLYIEKRRSYALDPVANFHLRNGASLWRLCPMADPSPSGMQRSFGVMVNYKYVLEDVAANNHAYIVDGTISVSAAVKQLTASSHCPSQLSG